MTKTLTAPLPGLISLPIVCLAFFAGCGGGSGDGFTGARGKVSGRVTIDGSPIPPGSIVMFQSEKGKTYLATGAVKADGKYELAYADGKGLPTVTYMVQIVPPAEEPASGKSAAAGKSAVVDPKNIPVGKDEVAKNTSGRKDVKLPFPAKYSSYNTSKLTFDVKAGSNTADFKLEK